MFKRRQSTPEIIILCKISTECTISFRTGRFFNRIFDVLRTFTLSPVQNAWGQAECQDGDNRENKPHHCPTPALARASRLRMKVSSGNVCTYCSMCCFASV